MLDVCLIVEGGYPYEAGGLSSWVGELVSGLSTLRFGVVHVGAGRDLPREPQVAVPDNVEQVVEVFPREPAPPRRPGTLDALLRLGRRLPALFDRRQRAAQARLASFYEKILAGGLDGLDAVLEAAAAPGSGGDGRGGGPGATGSPRNNQLRSVPGRQSPPGDPLAARLGPEPRSEVEHSCSTSEAPPGPAGEPPLDELTRSPEAWDAFVRLYAERAQGRPEEDRYRAWQATHAPLLRLLRTPVPEAAVYHTLSTGLGGILGALAARRTGAPLLLTQPTDALVAETRDGTDDDPMRAFLRRTVYRQAAEIISFSESGQRLAIRAGAPAERCRVVPKGIHVPRFAGLRQRGRPTAEKDGHLIACIGAVTPGKDPKTFLRAAKLLVDRLDLVELLIVGATSEDFAYYRECLLQAQMLSIDRLVRFTGPIDVRSLLVDLDCLVHTALSAGEPLALIEAMAAGVPCVATDAGACRELLEGRTPEDRTLGASGIIVPVGDHEAVADAVERCIRDQALRDRLVAAGAARADRYYRREELQAVYLERYQRLAAARRAGRA